ncbi:hypothetical protein FA13DRAFT_1741556 [Coprinellus micaceus]|uniref:Transcriptional regulator of RNA polII, SAGA, subunit n=1 Tax=Coprinellus micaceus TaxID=71717 RepID=A0A4Y7SIU8_COPMI|nr:hypothetical protein FA13DRAFT_1741556 [Coprinellus micaceus]
MSLDSTGNLKQQLVTHLGPKAPIYFDSLQAFVSGKISRGEFEDGVKQVLTSSALLQVHNALIISLFDATAAYKRSAAAAVQSQEQTATPPPTTATKPPPRKRRRTLLPYQGPGVSEDARSLRSMRLKRWVLAMGRKERERVKALYRVTIGPIPPPDTPLVPNQGAPMVVDGQPQPPVPITAQPQQPIPPAAPGRLDPPVDEIQSERGVMLLPERSGLPGGRPPIQLHSSTRAPTVQHIADRINLTCAQHNLAMPSRSVAALMSLACESKLKQLITHAITLTLSSQAISSIAPTTPFNSANPFVSMIASSSSQIDASSSIGGNAHSQISLPSLASSSTLHHIPQRTPVLTTAAFQSLFTLYPASLPNNSASAMRLSAIPTAVDDETDDLPVLKDREVRDQRWQIMALLAERSAVKEALKSVR